MAALSGVTPTWVHPMEPQFNVMITQAEGMNKNYLNMSGTSAAMQWRLVWKNLSDTKFWTLYKHFYDCKGPGTAFCWKDVPEYIDTNMDGTADGSDITVHYVAGSFRPTTNAKTFDAEVTIERAGYPAAA